MHVTRLPYYSYYACMFSVVRTFPSNNCTNKSLRLHELTLRCSHITLSGMNYPYSLSNTTMGRAMNLLRNACKLANRSDFILLAGVNPQRSSKSYITIYIRVLPISAVSSSNHARLLSLNRTLTSFSGFILLPLLLGSLEREGEREENH